MLMWRRLVETTKITRLAMKTRSRDVMDRRLRWTSSVEAKQRRQLKSRQETWVVLRSLMVWTAVRLWLSNKRRVQFLKYNMRDFISLAKIIVAQEKTEGVGLGAYYPPSYVLSSSCSGSQGKESVEEEDRYAVASSGSNDVDVSPLLEIHLKVEQEDQAQSSVSKTAVSDLTWATETDSHAKMTKQGEKSTVTNLPASRGQSAWCNMLWFTETPPKTSGHSEASKLPSTLPKPRKNSTERELSGSKLSNEEIRNAIQTLRHHAKRMGVSEQELLIALREDLTRSVEGMTITTDKNSRKYYNVLSELGRATNYLFDVAEERLYL